MKKIYYFLFVLAILMSSHVRAAIVVISVTNFQFSPANVNVNVGDIVRFNFVSGFHNATTNAVPGGLSAGAIALFSGNPGSASSYDYTVTVTGTYKYVCEIHGDAATFTGMVGQFTASVVVPIILKQFNVGTAFKKPLLTWITETELNAAYFSVRSSTDAVHFKEIARVSAAGNSTTQQSYRFTDNDIAANNKFIYYELAMIDNDGRQQLSDIKMFKNTLAKTKLVTLLSPNPISRPGQLMVYFNSEKKGMLKVKVFNTEGKMVYDTDMEAFLGLNSGHIHVCNFKAGVYTVFFSMDGLEEMKKVVVN